MTNYEVTSDEAGHHLRASWPDLPEAVTQPVAVFEELKLASVARTVLAAASRYRWHRWTRLVDEGIFGARGASAKPAGLPALSSSVVLGDEAMSTELSRKLEALVSAPDAEKENDSAEVGLALGNPRPLLWRDWCGHLTAEEHEGLSTELDADLAATTDGPPAGRARQAAWYLSAELLIDEDHSALARHSRGPRNEESTKAFQASLVRLLADLTGLRVESTAIDWDPDNEELLRVHSPVSVVGFWLDEECWYYGWPDPGTPEGEATVWQHAGTLSPDASIGGMATYITEQVAAGIWPFGGGAPEEKRGRFRNRR